MILKAVIAVVGIVIVGWVAWRLLTWRGTAAVEDHATPGDAAIQPPDEDAD